MKDIPGYKGLYAATTSGEIYSHRNRKYLKKNENNSGYYIVHLIDRDGEEKTYGVHRLVAITYIPNEEKLTDVQHINNNKHDNRVTNLKWVSNKERHKDAEVQNTKMPIAQCDLETHEVIKEFESASEASREVFEDDDHQSSISACAQGKTNSAYGYYWCYMINI